MDLLSLSYVLVALFINVWGTTLIVGVVWRNRWVATAAGPWLAATFFFGLESQIGFGRAGWLGPITIVLSLGIIAVNLGLWTPSRWLSSAPSWLAEWRSEFKPQKFWPCAALFLLFFGYALVWRYATPNIDGSSEKIADLAHIANYFTGDTIPVRDVWYYPYRSTQYYSFQYYAAALVGRSLGWSLGTTYNLGYCLLIGFTGVSFAGAVFVLTARRWIRVLVLLALMVGGSGVSGLTHLIFKTPQLWNTVRFIGIDVPYDGQPAGPLLMKYKAQFKRVELPGESFAYTATLGDYHPPLSGYYLLGVGVLSAVLAQRTGRRRYAALVGGTLTWSLIANTWTFPLQLAWVVGWAVWHRRQWKEIWAGTVIGALMVWFACATYLDVFAFASTEYKTAFRLVKPGDHTPPLLFLLFLWPTLVLAVLSFYTQRWHYCALGIATVLYLAFSEFVFIDDIYVVEFERFNTTLKWWPWIVAASLLVLGPPLLEHAERKWLRWNAILACAFPCVFAYDLVSYWFHTDKGSIGRLEGNAFLLKNERSRIMLKRLQMETPGVVIERPNKDSFTNSAVLPVFAGHRMWLGWMGHELLWRGYTDDVRQRQDRLMQFYRGEMDQPVNWLHAEGIDYVLWYQNDDTNELWAKMDHELRPNYAWLELFSAPDGRKTGMWLRDRAASKQ